MKGILPLLRGKKKAILRLLINDQKQNVTVALEIRGIDFQAESSSAPLPNAFAERIERFCALMRLQRPFM